MNGKDAVIRRLKRLLKPSGLEVTKFFSCSTQPSMEFEMLTKSKMLKIKAFLPFRCSDVVFIMLINIKMPTIIGILTFMSMINFNLS